MNFVKDKINVLYFHFYIRKEGNSLGYHAPHIPVTNLNV